MIGKKRKRAESESIVEEEVISAEKKREDFDGASESAKVQGAVVTPKKKKRKTAREDTSTVLTETEECVQNVKSLEEVVDPVEKEPQSPTFCVDTFVRSLQGAECLQALKVFVKEAEKDSEEECDVVGKFLAAGRSPEDVLRVVNTAEKKNLAVPTLAFSAARLVIMRILTDMPEQTVLAESACTFFIRAHLPIVHAMLSLASDAKQRKSALRLLSVVVTVSPELAQEVARNVTLSPPVLSVLTQRPQRRGRTNVRTCFVHFLLAFLVNGGGATCRLLLEKKGYLNSVIPGLVQDPADTVVLVLTTLREKVLENPAISKTVKVHVFNVPTVRSLLALYHWKGPNYLIMGRNRNKKSAVEIVQAEPDSEEKDLVAETAHELLLKLCCSAKHGVVFHDQSLGTSGVKHNPILYGVLQGLERPWENRWTCELALKMLKACPDLVRTLWPLMETLLAPRASHKWLHTIDFVEQVVSGFDPEVSLKPHVASFTPQQLCQLLLSFSAPAPVLKLAGTRGLEHPHLTVRNRTARLLGAMLALLHTRLEAVRSWGVMLPADLVTTFLVQYLPPAHVIYAAWDTAVGKDGVTEEYEELLPSPVEGAHESAILELLLLYRRCCPQLLDAVEFGEAFGGLLPAVLAMESPRGGTADGALAVAKLQVNAVRLLLSVDSQAFAPDKALFTSAGLLLFDLLDSAELRREVTSTLASLLESTGLFEMARQELRVWLHCFQAVESDSRRHVAKFLLRTVTELSADVKLYSGLMHRAEEAAAAASALLTREPPGVNVDTVEDILTGLMEKGQGKQRGAGSSRLKCSSLSPLLVATLQVDPDPGDEDDAAASISTFLSFVVVHLLHSQIPPSLLLEVVRLTPGRLPDTLTRYLEGWAGEGEPCSLKKPFPPASPTRRLSERLLRSDSQDRKVFAQADSGIISESSSDEDLVGLVDQTVFYATQLALKGRLNPVVQHKCAVALTTLLERAGSSDLLLESCLEKALCSPALVRGFDPQGMDDASLLSRLAGTLVRLARDRQQRLPRLPSLLEPLRDRFVACLTRRPGGTAAPVTVDLEPFLEAFQLSVEDVRALLEVCSRVDWTAKSCGWSRLLAHLLHRAADLSMGDLEESTLTAVVERLATPDLCRDKEMQGALEAALTNFLTACPHLITTVPAGLFESLVSSGSSLGSTAELLTLLLQRNRALRGTFSRAVLAADQGGEVVLGNQALFPWLFAEYAKGAANEEEEEDFGRVCEVARASYGAELAKFLKKPHKLNDWMKTCFPAVQAFTRHCCDVSMFSKMKSVVFENVRTMCGVDMLYLSSVEGLLSCVWADPAWRGEFVSALLESTARLTKAGTTDPADLFHLTELLSRRVAWVTGELQDHTAFCDVALRYGLKDEVPYQRQLLLILPQLCQALGEGGDSTCTAKTVFEKLVSHSRFLDIILGKTDSKTAILRLLLVLVKKVPSVMSADLVPVLLGAYSASLSTQDQLILQLLQLYESSGVALQGCQPYLWGEAAVNYFSVRRRSGPSLWNRPHASQVLDLLDTSYLEWTVTKFPYHRELKAWCVVEGEPELYDPAFLLPLLSHLLAPESPVPDYKVMQSGAVAFVLAALASPRRDVRAAACHVLARLHSHLQGSRSAKLWLQFVEAVRGGVAGLAAAAAAEDDASPSEVVVVPELPCVVALFLARTSLIISQPAHPMYLPLHNYVLAKPAMDLSIVPEFLILFHSSTLDHKTHRHWILEVLRDGIRYWKDVALCLHCVLYKMIMDFYSSSLADTHTKTLCLSILESTVRIPKAAQLLVRSYSLVPWLSHSVARLEVGDCDASLRTAMLDAVTTLASSLQAGNSNVIATLLVQLLPHLERSSSSSEAAVLKFLRALRPSASSLPREDLEDVVRVCGGALGCTGDCQVVMKYGLVAETVKGDTTESPKGILREIVCRWLRDTTTNRENQVEAVESDQL